MYWLVTIAVIVLINTVAFAIGSALGPAGLDLAKTAGALVVVGYLWYRIKRRPRASGSDAVG